MRPEPHADVRRRRIATARTDQPKILTIRRPKGNDRRKIVATEGRSGHASNHDDCVVHGERVPGQDAAEQRRPLARAGARAPGISALDTPLVQGA